MDIPKPISKPSRRLSFSALRGELAPKTTPTLAPFAIRSIDTPSPLYTSYTRSSSPASGYSECDVCGHMQYIGNGTYAPHSGCDDRTVQFPTTFYTNGALNLDYVSAYAVICDSVMRWSLSVNRDLVGPPPPTDLFQAAIDRVNKKPSVLDGYVFDRSSSYLWEVNSSVTLVNSESKPLVTENATIPTTNLRPTATPTFFPTRAPTFAPQSGNVGEQTSVPMDDIQHLTNFHDENTDWAVSVNHSKDHTYYTADVPDVSLAKYFERPLLIYNGLWDNTGGFTFNIDPWSLYFDNPRVSNRISNYRNLRCNLHVKVLVNGTPFDYGRAMIFYSPLPKEDIYLSSDPRFGITDFIANSQRPHIYIDPCTSQGGTMCLPYFYPHNSLLIPSREWANMGRLAMSVIVPLKNCNGSSDPVSISIFAWAEDVVLSCPTSMEPTGLVAQAGDEYGEGIISRPAAIIAHAAGALRVVKYIAPYATAAQMAAGTVGFIAKLFGMSRPNIVSDTIYVKHDPCGHLSNVDRPDPIQKLTYDSKQAITIDPRTVGLAGIDEMHIASIASRESYLTTFPWSRVATPGTKIFEIAVMPSVWGAGVLPLSGGRLAVQLPACAAMALPFNYWRGSMKYRVQIVKSSFHRGRLRLVYEPGTSPSPTCEYNTNMSEIIDIGDNTDFTFQVGWHSNQSYLQIASPGLLPVSSIYKSTAVFPTGNAPILTSVDLPGVSNGSISFYVVNTLEAPAPASTVNNDISIMISVSACDDFEVNNPIDILDKYTFSPQMGAEQVLTDPERAHPTGPPMLAMFGAPIPVDSAASIFYGDPITNIRTILKRYVLADVFQPKSATVGPIPVMSSWKLTLSAFPAVKGLHPFGRHTLGTKAAYVVNNTHLNYYSPMFQARRGGIRNKFVCQGDAYKLTTKVITRTTKPQYGNTVVNAGITLSDESLFAKIRLFDKYTGFTGTSVNLSTNELFEAEVPYHSNKRFISARTRRADDSSDYPIVLESLLPESTVCTKVILDRYVAAADDYNLFWFTGLPTIIFLPDGSVVS